MEFRNEKLRNLKKEILRIDNKELINLLLSRDGGKTTLKILDIILEKPSNANQISNKLDLDYNTITYHMKIAQELEFVERKPIGKTYIFHPSDKLIKCIGEYNIIKSIIENETK